MKRNLFIVLAIFLIALVSTFVFYNNSFADTCEGRCTGSEYCSACKNCTACKHCNSGGSCGVCASPRKPSEKKVNTSSNSSSHKTTSYGSSKSNSQTKSVVSKEYFVEPVTISVRKSPLPAAQVICTLKEFEYVTLLKMYDAKWAQIEFVCDGITMTGYTIKSYLIKVEN